MLTEQNIKVGCITVIACIIIAIAAWIFIRSPGSDTTASPDASFATSDLASSSTVLPLTPVVKTNRNTYSLPTSWSYKNSVVADALPSKYVSSIPAGILVDANSGRT